MSCPPPVVPRWVILVARVTAFTELSCDSSIAEFSLQYSVENNPRILREACGHWGQFTGTISRNIERPETTSSR